LFLLIDAKCPNFIWGIFRIKQSHLTAYFRGNNVKRGEYKGIYQAQNDMRHGNLSHRKSLMGSEALKDEKTRLEAAAISWFIDQYEMLYEVKYEILEHYGEGAISKPDFILKSAHQEIAVEVTHLFIDEKEAQLLLGKPHGSKREPQHFDDLIKSLNKLIAKKAAKKYRYDGHIELVIRSASPIFSASDFVSKFQHINLDNTERFHHIWLLTQDEQFGKWSLLKLK
jgi:hypothetical protein